MAENPSKQFITLVLLPGESVGYAIVSGCELTLEELQALVGGYIQVTTCRYNGQDLQMVVNEDGRVYDLEPNLRATGWHHSSLGMTVIRRLPNCMPYILGVAVVPYNWRLS